MVRVWVILQSIPNPDLHDLLAGKFLRSSVAGIPVVPRNGSVQNVEAAVKQADMIECNRCQQFANLRPVRYNRRISGSDPDLLSTPIVQTRKSQIVVLAEDG